MKKDSREDLVYSIIALIIVLALGLGITMVTYGDPRCLVAQCRIQIQGNQ